MISSSNSALVSDFYHEQQSLRRREGCCQRSGLQRPCTAPAAPPSLCISTTAGTVPQIFGFPADDQASADSPMGDEGVMG
jgi:hypothetical protein